MTKDANPDPEDDDPLDEGEGQQSRQIDPRPEDDDPPEDGKGQQSRRIDPGPHDDDPPSPKRPQVNSFFRSLRHMFARFFHRP